MKKIININLSGRVIPIEDAAYEKLQGYIESLRRYFANEDGRDEIINDIESRIAELMNDRVRKGAAAVTEADVEDIIASMGRPEDFESMGAEETESGPSAGPAQAETGRRSRGRLYRDSSDKFIGGVCSGIANYLNTDPAIVRILFAIITFGGFGLGFLLYILLWMILPTRDLDTYGGKRLFRNPDDRMIGGVAGGLAAYFGSRTSTVRLIFAAPFIFSALVSMLDWFSWGHGFSLFPNIFFGSIGGTFFLAYIVLWIVLPEARTNYEKMEMRGEKVDVNSIRQNVREGMGSVKDRVKGWSEEVKESAQNFSSKAKDFANTRGKEWASEVSETARRSGSGFGHAIGVLFKAFFLFIAGTIAFALFVALIALLFGGIAWWPINNYLWTSNWQQIYAWGTLIFFIAVPLIAFITWVIRRVMRVRSRSSYLGWTFGALWTVGWVSMILLASSLFRDFREYESVSETVQVVQPVDGKMIVAVTAPELEYTGSYGWINDDSEGWDLSTDSLKLSWVRFSIDKSVDDQYHVTIRKHGNGRTEDEALLRASKIQYSVSSYDNILDLANGFAVDKDSKYRGQNVEIEIQVPVGKKIRFDRTVREKLNADGPRIKTSRNRRVVDLQWDDYGRYYFKSEVDYTMDAEGNLRDEDGRILNRYTGRSYESRRNRAESDSFEIKRQLEQEKKRLEDAERRIRELEQKKNEIQKSGTKNESMDDGDDDWAGIGSPSVLSLIKWN
jgi:phage shock protein PspC (stress-responsive transcriptional regulator)